MTDTADEPSEKPEFFIDFGSIMSRSYQTLWSNLGALVIGTATYVLALIGANLPYALVYYLSYEWSSMEPGFLDFFLGVAKLVTSIGAALVVYVLWGGYWKYILGVIRKESPGLTAVFDGFQFHPLQLVLVGIIGGIGVSLGFCCLVLPGIYLIVAWTLAVPLIIDQSMEFWTALETSRQRVTTNWFMMAAVWLLFFMLTLLGVLLAGVGLLVTLPLGMLALAFAYEDNLVKHVRRPIA